LLLAPLHGTQLDELPGLVDKLVKGEISWQKVVDSYPHHIAQVCQATQSCGKKKAKCHNMQTPWR